MFVLAVERNWKSIYEMEMLCSDREIPILVRVLYHGFSGTAGVNKILLLLLTVLKERRIGNERIGKESFKMPHLMVIVFCRLLYERNDLCDPAGQFATDPQTGHADPA